MRSRGPLVVAIVAAVASAALVGTALVLTDRGSARLLLGFALGGLAVVVAVAGGAWAAAGRRRDVDPLVERAETASKLSHELKNPLMAIKGLASTGARMFDQMEDEERREFFQLIDEESGRLKRVIEQSATAMKVDADQLVYDLREERLGALVERVVWEVPHGEHPFTVEADSQLTVLGDRKYLSEAIANVIENACKFSPPDAPIEVTVRRDDDEAAVVEIADRGPGVPPERVVSVFERFANWRPAGYEETPGAGLGLFLARAHVLAHGGRMFISDRDDGGTILRITLPAE
jgi:signal transduction histidine kinase